MIKPRYQTTISYSDEELVKITKCKEANYSMMDVFRLGLDKAVDQIEQGESEKLKEGNNEQRRDKESNEVVE